jgi:hypothetical protein
LHDLKIDNKNLEQEFLISKLKNCFQEHNSNNKYNKSEHSYEEESSNNLISNDVKIISLINKVVLHKWYAKVDIVVAQDYAFYIRKNAEIERGVPRLVINYKPINNVLEWIRYPIPNRKDLVSRLSDALVFSKFDMKSGF